MERVFVPHRSMPAPLTVYVALANERPCQASPSRADVGVFPARRKGDDGGYVRERRLRESAHGASAQRPDADIRGHRQRDGLRGVHLRPLGAVGQTQAVKTFPRRDSLIIRGAKLVPIGLPSLAVVPPTVVRRRNFICSRRPSGASRDAHSRPTTHGT